MAGKINIRRYYKHVPNILTSLNIFCGSLSIVFAFQGELLLAAYLLLLAFHFDVFDGLSARLLKAQSEMGKELDSLADVVSFGLGPAAILFGMLKPALGIESISLNPANPRDYLIFIPFILPVFAALRLARFNLNTDKTSNFVGMPTPANALLVLAIPLIAHHHPESFLVHWFNTSTGIIIYSLAASFLMVSSIPFYGLKMKGFSWSTNKYTYIFLAGVAATLIAFGFTGIFLIVVLYLVYGLTLALILPDRSS